METKELIKNLRSYAENPTSMGTVPLRISTVNIIIGELEQLVNEAEHNELSTKRTIAALCDNISNLKVKADKWDNLQEVLSRFNI